MSTLGLDYFRSWIEMKSLSFPMIAYPISQDLAIDKQFCDTEHGIYKITSLSMTYIDLNIIKQLR